MSQRIVRATHGAAERPLRIGDIEIPCYVLEDGRRVLSQRGLMSALGIVQGSFRGGKGGAARLVGIITAVNTKVNGDKGLTALLEAPIVFTPPHGGQQALGYEATILADICDRVLEARKAGGVTEFPAFPVVAAKCEILLRGFARVGIIALVDEATGYQQVRARDVLAEILKKYISDELLKWAKRFPDEFYQEMFRLRGWDFNAMAGTRPKRPGAAGLYTKDLVYSRLAPGVLDELEKRNPPKVGGGRHHRHHQYLTEDVGHPKLRDHISGIIALMRASKSWSQFMAMVQRAYPKPEQLSIDGIHDED